MKKGRSLLIEDLTGGLDPHAQPSELGRALEYAVNVGRAPLPEGVRIKRPFRKLVVDHDPLDEQRRVKKLAGQVFGDEQKAMHWLSTPKDRLSGRSPLEMLETSQGLQEVERVLIALQEGYF